MAGAEHLHWGAEAVWRRLEPLLPGIGVEVVARIDSTNTALIDRARRSGGQRDAPVSRPGELDGADSGHTPLGRRSDDTRPHLLVAEHQTRGRGRLGRTWQATPGASLTFSLALPLAPADWSGLSLAVGVTLAQALEPRPDGTPRLQLKWPNDLWLDGARKLGGVLIETVPVGARRMCVVGIGLNVLPQATEDLQTGYACLHELDAGATAPGALLAVAEPLVRALLRFERDGFAPFEADFAARDLLRGRAVTTTLAEAPAGVAEGVDGRGALRLRSGDTLHTITGGEVSVRLDALPPAA